MHELDSDPNMRRLVAEHPLLFREQLPRCSSQLSNGWYELVSTLCRDIELVFGVEGCDAFVCHQIKEKFGALRFYWSHGEARDIYIDFIDVDGAVSGTISRGEFDSQKTLVRSLVETAMSASEVTCEECGRPGNLKLKNGWYLTRCNEHGGAGWLSEASHD